MNSYYSLNTRYSSKNFFKDNLYSLIDLLYLVWLFKFESLLVTRYSLVIIPFSYINTLYSLLTIRSLCVVPRCHCSSLVRCHYRHASNIFSLCVTRYSLQASRHPLFVMFYSSCLLHCLLLTTRYLLLVYYKLFLAIVALHSSLAIRHVSNNYSLRVTRYS